MMVIHRQFTELLFKEFLILTQKSQKKKAPQKRKADEPQEISYH